MIKKEMNFSNQASKVTDTGQTGAISHKENKQNRQTDGQTDRQSGGQQMDRQTGRQTSPYSCKLVNFLRVTHFLSPFFAPS